MQNESSSMIPTLLHVFGDEWKGTETLICDFGVYSENYEIVSCIEALISFEGLVYGTDIFRL